ncbi:MAG: hypothetical protein ACK5JT_16195 [Hyphomicrobiaceae bacterium]
MFTISRHLVAGISALVFSSPIFFASHAASAAQSPKQRVYTYPPRVEAYCTGDYHRHCSPYELGSTALRRCMEAKAKDLSPGCQQALIDAGYATKYKRR